MIINLQPITNYTAVKLPISAGGGNAARSESSAQNGGHPQNANAVDGGEQKNSTQAMKSDKNEAKQKAGNSEKDSGKDSGKNNGVSSQKAFFAVDDQKNVVIRIVDAQGNVVKQIPPDEYLKSAQAMETSNQKLFHTEV
ncbi:MAG: flagellar protein FlaG [Nitrospirae bacterium]|nr:flagellar protein FlaG [Nitrospirota bacterium]